MLLLPFNNIKTIFFDYDGTLHDSIKIYAPAFKKAYSYLVSEGLAEERKWEDSDIRIWLGYNAQEMWQSFMPHLDQPLRDKCSKLVSSEMKTQIDEGKPQLYSNALDILDYLKNKGYNLVFISNCGQYYLDAHSKLFNLEKYFNEMACSEQFSFIPKSDILGKIKDKYPKDMVIIGDRAQDIEAGKQNNIYTIGCSFGYAKENELNEADLIIDTIEDLKKYF
jgi:phosphoglycolate phosphatase